MNCLIINEQSKLVSKAIFLKFLYTILLRFSCLGYFSANNVGQDYLCATSKVVFQKFCKDST